MLARPHRIRIFRWVIGVLLFVLLLVTAVPLWFPWAMGLLLPRHGLNYGAYERHGYSRFALRQFTFDNGSIRIRADRVETFVPTVLLWRYYFGHRQPAQIYLQIDRWSVAQAPTQRPPQSPSSIPSLINRIESNFNRLQAWIPTAEFREGKVQLASGEFAIPTLRWQNGRLNGRVTTEKLHQLSDFSVQLREREPS